MNVVPVGSLTGFEEKWPSSASQRRDAGNGCTRRAARRSSAAARHIYEAHRRGWHNAVRPFVAKGKAYISAALRDRVDVNATFLRVPFEWIDEATDEEMQSAVVKRRVSGDLFKALQRINQD